MTNNVDRFAAHIESLNLSAEQHAALVKVSGYWIRQAIAKAKPAAAAGGPRGATWANETALAISAQWGK